MPYAPHPVSEYTLANRLADYIRAHGFTPLIQPNGSVSFSVPYTAPNSAGVWEYAGDDVMTVSNWSECRAALGY